MTTSAPKKNQTSSAVVSLIVLGFAIWYLWGGGREKQAQTALRDIEAKVATDAVEQYRIAERQGDKMQICVQAGIVSAAYLQAKDEANYRIWKITEKTKCSEVGISQ